MPLHIVNEYFHCQYLKHNKRLKLILNHIKLHVHTNI